MSNPAPRRRPLFQFHLSTGIVLMLVAGGVIWLNLQVRSASLSSCFSDSQPMQIDRLGWPYPFIWTSSAIPQSGTIESFVLSPPLQSVSSFELLSRATSNDFRLTEALDDAFIAFLILALAFGAWEGVLRVRAFLAAEAEEVESGG